MNKANGVLYWQDWDNEGGIRMKNAKTIKRYRELKAEHPKTENYGVFYAFGEKQFEEGRQGLIRRGYLKDGEKVCSAGMGMYGTKDEIHRYLDFYAERSKKIAEECDPQEVYFCEWNDHECMISSDDDDALKVVISYFGKEAAHKIVRVYPGTPTNILAPLTERDRHLGEYDHQLMMLSRLKFDCKGFFNEHDCRYLREDTLYGGHAGSFVEEMRKLYRQLPDDIKDASPMSGEQLEDYAKRLEEWADEEYGKVKYDPVPRTKRADLPEEIELCDKLIYKDDDGMWQVPHHVWFSCDTRRWRKDGKLVHGRAMTTYLGKNGTTLTPVYIMQDSLVPYRRDDLCDVSCRYDYAPLHGKLHSFYYE